MGAERKSNWGMLAIVAAALFVAVGYWIVSAEGTPTLPFALAQYVLLGCTLAGSLDSFAKCRPTR